MGETGLVRFLASAGPPLWVLVLFVIGYIVRQGPALVSSLAEWVKARATIRGDLLDRAMARLDRLEIRDEECQRALADAVRRIAQLEGYDEGQGRARQEAATYLANERLKDKGQSRP